MVAAFFLQQQFQGWPGPPQEAARGTLNPTDWPGRPSGLEPLEPLEPLEGLEQGGVCNFGIAM